MVKTFRAWIFVIILAVSSCTSNDKKSDNLELAVNFLGIKNVSNYDVKEKGNSVILNDKKSDEQFICTVSDSNYIKTYKYYSSSDDSFIMSFHNDSILVNDFSIDLLEISPSAANWPTDEVIEFTFPRIPFGRKTLRLIDKDSIGTSTIIDSVNVVDGKASFQIPFELVSENGFSISYRFSSKYSKFSIENEHVFSR
ncbi:MAG: hypothetical protein ACPGLV_16030 [Bacteroidia bacterium]